jgi:putative transposase
MWCEYQKRNYMAIYAISIARIYMGQKQNLNGENLWAKGYYVSAAGREEESIRKYIRKQEAEDKRLDHLELFRDN